MKIAIVGDCHLNKSTFKGVMDEKYTSLPFRSVDNMKAFKFACDKCIDELKPDLFVIPGDTYDTHSPSNDVRGFFTTQLSRLNENGIHVIILLGNHDVCRKNHALKEIFGLNLENIKVVENYSTVEIDGYELLLFPYSMDQEKQVINAKDEFREFINEIHKKNSDLPKIFIGHCGVKGATINEYFDSKTNSKKNFINHSSEDVSVEELDEIGAEYVILGDYHRHQVLPTNKCIAMYTGSIERTDFSEKDHEKGFVFFDSGADEVDKMGKCRFVKYPSPRPMLELEGNMEAIRHAFNNINKDDYKRAIVKIAFKGNSDELVKFSIGLEDFKKEIADKVDAIHVFHTRTVEDPDINMVVSKLEKEIMERGHVEEGDVIEVAIELVNERVEMQDQRDAIALLAREIHAEATS